MIQERWTQGITALALGLVALQACNDSFVLDPIWEEPLIEGEITNVGIGVGEAGRLAFLVEARGESSQREDRVIFYIGDHTIVEGAGHTIVEGAGTVGNLSVEDLVVGVDVRVWPRGVVITTSPAQANAGRVEVLDQ